MAELCRCGLSRKNMRNARGDSRRCAHIGSDSPRDTKRRSVYKVDAGDPGSGGRAVSVLQQKEISASL